MVQSNKPKLTESEANYAEDAIEEIRTQGKTDKRCVKCGKEFVLEDFGTGYIIKCKTEDCFKLTSKGI